MQKTILNNRYELERKIGEGGMARVYLARDARLGRPVAVKVLHSHYSNDAGFLQRFEHEAEAAARISHPNVVDIFDVGTDTDIHYIVMEYIAGRDLKRIITTQGPLEVERAIQIAEQVALGLEAAHRLGLVHRDVKPQNILVGDDGQVHLTDFGIAKSHLSTALTETGVAFGTADYISPEQAQGLPATPQSDIYALGVTLYEMLSGRLPFNGDTSIVVAMQHVNTTPIPPRQLNPRIPAGIDALVMRALAKDPAQRPVSALEFARLLRNYRELVSSDTVVSAARPQPRPVTTAPRPQPLPPRPAVAEAPRQGGLGCGVFALGMLLLAGVLGIVVLVSSGYLDDLFPAGGSVQRQTPAVSETAEPAQTATLAPTVGVPNLVGLTESEASQTAIALGLTPVPGAQRNDDQVEAGRILAQEPAADSLVPIGSSITLTVSLGPPFVDVPNVVALRQRDAVAQLERLGFQVELRDQASAVISAGIVSDQDPRPPARLPRGDTVILLVSIGDRVRVPDTEGLDVNEAQRVIEQAGLFVSFVDLQSPPRISQELYDSTAPNAVLSSAPAPGTLVERNSGVTLGVRAP